MRSRSSRGSISSIYSPVNEASVTVARSEPEPLTHRIRAGRPRKSTSSALAEVLPPPQLHTERSAPSLRERATSCASTVDTETFAITVHPFIAQSEGLSRIPTKRAATRAPTRTHRILKNLLLPDKLLISSIRRALA